MPLRQGPAPCMVRRERCLCPQGDAMAMPFEDASFDAATMGYGLRNVADIPAALRVGCWPPFCLGLCSTVLGSEVPFPADAPGQ